MSLKLTRRSNKKFVAAGIVAFLLCIAGIGGAQHNSSQSSTQSKPTTQTEPIKGAETTKAPVIETKTITETEAIPYNKKTEDDSTLDSGKTTLAVPGVDGEKTITYQVTYTDSQETSRIKTDEQVTTQPIDEVTKVGVKTPYSAQETTTCPNGSYINSTGNTVCSPYASSSIPAGATAQCRDGTYSSSQSRRGTCSSHGGVATWY